MQDKHTSELARRVRFCLNPALPPTAWRDAPRHNTFASWPGMAGLGTFYEIEVRCRGLADPVTGYLVNISVIDEYVRRIALPTVHDAMRRDPLVEPARVLRSILEPMREVIGAMLSSVRWFLTPYHSITMDVTNLDRVLIAQQFEFAAAHRLHVEAMTTEENRAVFGRCNNPSSHGHNYRLEVAVFAPIDGGSFSIDDMERIVSERVIQRFDHTNLNMDVSEFARMNPSVENIAKVCYELLCDEIEQCGGDLSHVTVWETEKTSSTYGRRT